MVDCRLSCWRADYSFEAMSCSEWIAPDRCGAGVCASKVSSAKRNLLFAVTAVHVHGVLNVAAPYWHYLQKSFGSYIVSALDVSLSAFVVKRARRCASLNCATFSPISNAPTVCTQDLSAWRSDRRSTRSLSAAPGATRSTRCRVVEKVFKRHAGTTG